MRTSVIAAGSWLLVGGCVAGEVELAIKPIPAPVSAEAKPASARISEARGYFALGNVGLALEAYRKVYREDPRNTDALTGLAACYDRMGRFELSRRYYEEALAVAPADPALLSGLAAALEGQGQASGAAAVRKEVNARTAAPSAAYSDINVALSAETVLPSSPSITVKLPPPTKTAPDSGMRSTPANAPASAEIAPRSSNAPRLERLSLGEVALVTSGRPRWRAELVVRTAESTTVRFVPLAPAQELPSVRLLNAARHDGLARRTRTLFNRKGWSEVTIGDAARVRQTSLVLYSPATAVAARKLASEFGFAVARDPRARTLTVLLGRDAVRLSRARG